MASNTPDDSRVVSVRLPTPLLQRLDRLLDWHTTHRRRPTTRNAALRAALGDWLFWYQWPARQRCVAGLCAGGPGATMPSLLVGPARATCRARAW